MRNMGKRKSSKVELDERIDEGPVKQKMAQKLTIINSDEEKSCHGSSQEGPISSASLKQDKKRSKKIPSQSADSPAAVSEIIDECNSTLEVEGNLLIKQKGKKKKLDHHHETKGESRALKYLDKWNEFQSGKCSDWKFEKCRQIWLLVNAYNDDKISDEKFDLLLQYMDSIKGRMRQTALETAEKKVQLEEKWSTATKENSGDADLPLEPRPKEKEVERAKEIILMLQQ